MVSDMTSSASPGVRPRRFDALPTVTATVPVLEPPAWALAERHLFDLLDHAWRRFAACYTEPDGSLRYRRRLTSRDGVDDFYEAFFNWPQLYLLGGADDLLPAAERHWHGVTRQLTELGMLRDGYERGYDWFHQGESLLLLYGLCMAAPDRWRERAVGFAELYVDPARGNYDADLRIITRPHNGSDPDRTGLFDGGWYPWLPEEERLYGFPLDWLPTPGTAPSREDDPRLGAEMADRLGRGDVAMNMAVAGLVLNAFILTGDDRYRAWILGYVGGWRERTRANGGIVPDNVGRDGVVGSQLGGRWYGGHYGWSWPHGLYSVGQAAVVGALAAAVAGRDDGHLDLVRSTLDYVIAEGRVMRYREADSSMPVRGHAHLGEYADRPTLLVPFRRSDRGWFDFNPVHTAVPMALWFHSGADADRARLDDLRAGCGYDWRTVRPFRDKEEGGHEEPWYAYLRGDNPGYPDLILGAAQAQVRRRLALIDRHPGVDVPEADIHLWQQTNPVVTEALTQLTWGGPQVVYNGGLAQARVRYHDADARRPGLPPSVAALVSRIDPAATVLELVNLDPARRRRVVVQAGAFSEHAIRTVGYTSCPDRDWPGSFYDYLHRPIRTVRRHLGGAGPWLAVTLPPGTRIELTLELAVRSGPVTYAGPFDAGGAATS
ncbi:hypothetical protein ACFFWC_28615 [Plantactinospora siamensis]|uniref:Linalool dehydratase/isomerase domain-containing protein n=1 Tax=Plantactinospora siamensis TaxID=555372 RepID=A0ABV6NWD9_9ACTN